jgi:hypothetical protein
MQLFFMVAGLSTGIRVVDDIKHWIETRATGSPDA